jgi:hypothetical protein
MLSNKANRSEWVADEVVGKFFIVIFANGDLPDNPMSLCECAVCGEVFTREQASEHYFVPCHLSSEQPIAATGRA